jgi:hypothetical protein
MLMNTQRFPNGWLVCTHSHMVVVFYLHVPGLVVMPVCELAYWFSSLRAIVMTHVRAFLEGCEHHQGFDLESWISIYSLIYDFFCDDV